MQKWFTSSNQAEISKFWFFTACSILASPICFYSFKFICVRLLLLYCSHEKAKHSKPHTLNKQLNKQGNQSYHHQDERERKTPEREGKGRRSENPCFSLLLLSFFFPHMARRLSIIRVLIVLRYRILKKYSKSYSTNLKEQKSGSWGITSKKQKKD